MGVIQNSFNQLLGISAAAGAVASKHFEESAELRGEQSKMNLEQEVLNTKETGLKEHKKAIDETFKGKELNSVESQRYQMALKNYQEKKDAYQRQLQDFEDRKELLRIRQEKHDFGMFADTRNRRDMEKMKSEKGKQDILKNSEFLHGGKK